MRLHVRTFAHLHARLLRVAQLGGANRAAARVDLAPRDHPAQRKGWAVVAPAAITVAATTRAARRGCLVGAVGLAALATRADSPTDEGAARRVAAPGRVVALLLQLDDAIAAGGGGGGALTVRVARAGAARRVEARPTDLHVHVCTCMCMCVCVHVCTCVHVCACVCVCVYVVYMCICVYAVRRVVARPTDLRTCMCAHAHSMRCAGELCACTTTHESRHGLPTSRYAWAP